MKSTLSLLLLLSFLFARDASAQMNGAYTVGGDSPDFETPQEAADSLLSKGVSGPVNILMRPGVYEAGTDGDSPVLVVDREIPGASRANHVTFRSDASAGGDSSNVILQRNVGGTVVALYTAPFAPGVSFITLDGFATVVKDMTAGVRTLDAVISLYGGPSTRRLEDVQVRGMRIDGSGRRAGFGIWAGECTTDMQFIGNHISGAAQALQMQCLGSSGLRIEGNRIDGSGYRQGGANPSYVNVINITVIAPTAQSPMITDNVIDMTGQCGASVIGVSGPSADLRIERNQMINYACGGGDGSGTSGAIYVIGSTGHTVVANNMISVGTGGTPFRDGGPAMALRQEADSMLIAHNTTYSFNAARGPELNGAGTGHVGVFDNIFLASQGAAIVTKGNFVRDYNILSRGEGIGPHSRLGTPQFLDPVRDLHLGECAIEDSSLMGIAQMDVPLDFDGGMRDPSFPFIGADEPEAGPPIFDGPTAFDSGMQSFLMTSADMDDDGNVDLIVTNVAANDGGNDVTLLWNDGTGHFSEPDPVSIGTGPSLIRVGRVNADEVADIVVVAEDGIHVVFGLGNRNFSPPVEITGDGAWVDLDLGDYDNDGDTDVFALLSPPTDSAVVVAYINEGNGTFSFTDARTFARTADDIALADINGDGFLDVLAVDNTTTNEFYTLRNLGLQAQGVSRGFDAPTVYPIGVSSAPAASRFLVEDFDGDLDVDVVLADATSDSLGLLRNDGNGVFGDWSAFQPHQAGAPRLAVALDYDGDGDKDIVSASLGSKVDLLINRGTGTFTRFALCGTGSLGGFPNGMVAVPLDADESADVAVLTANDEVELLRNLNWKPTFTAVEPPIALAPELHLHPNYPNPFRHSTTLAFSLPERTHVTLEVFDMLGRRVAKLVDEQRPAGEQAVNFQGDNLASGVYLYRLATDRFVDTMTMVIRR